MILGCRSDFIDKSQLVFIVRKLLSVLPPRLVAEEVANLYQVLKVRSPFELSR